MKLVESRAASFTVEGGTTAEFFYHLTPERRGRYEFGRTSVRYLSNLGLSGARQTSARR